MEVLQEKLIKLRESYQDHNPEQTEALYTNSEQVLEQSREMQRQLDKEVAQVETRLEVLEEVGLF